MIFKCLFERFSLKFFCVLILLQCLPPRIRIHMDIFGILGPDPNENLCGYETLEQTVNSMLETFRRIAILSILSSASLSPTNKNTLIELQLAVKQMFNLFSEHYSEVGCFQPIQQIQNIFCMVSLLIKRKKTTNTQKKWAFIKIIMQDAYNVIIF